MLDSPSVEASVDLNKHDDVLQAYSTSLDGLKQALMAMQEGHTTDGTSKRSRDLLLLKLREGNRNLSLHQRACKKQVQTARSIVEKLELSRQGYLYEKNHLLASIEDARRHDSLYRQIPIALDEDAINQGIQHDTVIAQLKCELEKRKALADKLKSSNENLELARSRLVLKRKELERLRDHVSSVCKAAEVLINSNARLFEARQASKAQNAMEVTSTTSTAPMDVLSERLALFAESHDYIRLQIFEGEEMPEEGEFEEGEEPGIGDGEESETKGHTRFSTSHHASAIKRFISAAYIRVDILKTDLSECLCSCFFYQSSSNGTIAMAIELTGDGDEENQPSSVSSSSSSSILFSLSLQLDTTNSNGSVEPDVHGGMAFAWLQSLIDDRSDTNTILEKLFNSLQQSLIATTPLPPPINTSTMDMDTLVESQ